MDPEEWQARLDLAAAHRILDRQGFSEGIRNHLTLSVPGHVDQVLIMPFGLHWSEVTASCFMVVDLEGKVVRGKGEVERSTFCLHVPLLPAGQTEVGLLESIAYDPRYTGLGYEVEEGERIAQVLGEKSILFMAHHGVMVTGRTAASAYEKLFYLERACRAQMFAMWTGKPLKLIEEDVIQKTRAQFRSLPLYYGKTADVLHFEALKRMLARTDPDFAN